MPDNSRYAHMIGTAATCQIETLSLSWTPSSTCERWWLAFASRRDGIRTFGNYNPPQVSYQYGWRKNRTRESGKDYLSAQTRTFDGCPIFISVIWEGSRDIRGISARVCGFSSNRQFFVEDAFIRSLRCQCIQVHHSKRWLVVVAICGSVSLILILHLNVACDCL